MRRNRSDGLDPFFADERARGELIVAHIRLTLVGVAALVPLVIGGRDVGRWLPLSLAAAALVVAFCLYLLARRVFRPWLAVVSSLTDVTLVSAGLAVPLVLHRPGGMLESQALFDAYFLAIAGASLRYDWRLCVLTGTVATVQYAMLLVYAVVRFPLAGAVVDGGAQVVRIALLATATVVATLLVLGARRLRRLSTTDRLTGVTNRGAFDERLLAEASRARRHDHPLTVALIDVDQFKRFNDAHGHAGGDVVLRVLADTLVASVRRSDVVARYGGEEFVLILPETGAHAAMGRLESLRRIVAATPIDIGQGTGLVHVTVSIGVASWPEDGVEISDVLACADTRLYDAKRLGRDRTLGPSVTTGVGP